MVIILILILRLPAHKDIFTCGPCQSKFLMRFEMHWHEIGAFQYDKETCRMCHAIHIAQSVVIMRQSFAYFLDMCEIMQTAFFCHFAERASLDIFTEIDPTREKSEQTIVSLQTDRVLLRSRIEDDGQAAITPLFVLAR